jgi:hypothetical protein
MNIESLGYSITDIAGDIEIRVRTVSGYVQVEIDHGTAAPVYNLGCIEALIKGLEGALELGRRMKGVTP